MPKKKKPSQPNAPTPTWFPKLAETAPYTTIQVAPEEVQEWLRDVARACLNPEAWAEIDKSFQQLAAFQSRHERSLATVQWSEYGGHELLWHWAAALSLQRALDVFLPPPFDQWPQPVRVWLYVLELIVAGTAEAASPHPSHPDPLELARMAIHVRTAAPYTAREIQRRLRQHVGSPVGELLFWRELDQPDPVDPLLPPGEMDSTVVEVMDKLRKCTWRRTAGRVNRAVGDMSEVAKTLSQVLSSEIYETIVTRWGSLEGLDALARSLDGAFNITPRAVTDRVMKADRIRELFPSPLEQDSVPLPTEENGVVFVQRRDEIRDYKPSRITLSITEEDPAHPNSIGRQAKDILKRFLRRYPKHRDGIELFLSNEKNENLAKKRGVTVQTIINRKNKAQEALKHFAEKL